MKARVVGLGVHTDRVPVTGRERPALDDER
jgi:hypothetical protein